MFDRIKQIIKEKYGDKAALYEPNLQEEAKSKTIWAEPVVQEPKLAPHKQIGSARFDAGKSKKSNRNRLSHNAKLKRRRG